MKKNVDRESAELERAYPGLLARLGTESLDRLAREYQLPKSLLVYSRDRVRQLEATPPGGRKGASDAITRQTAPERVVAVVLPPSAVVVKDTALQIGLEQAYPGITQSLSRRDDVEVAIQFGISLPAIARIRELLGVERVEVSSPVAHPKAAPARALPARLVASRD
ncbi:MAG: hypothetical protein EXR69_03700 [Myxococcales bacterium]|nr:hypothetical protein [Myxococcales bacterium]